MELWKRFVLVLLCFLQNILQTYSEFLIRRHPNIVVIAVNQLGLKDFALYADKINHIRGLGEKALTFSHVYSHLYPTSSRAALLTGRLPVKSGMLKGRFLPFASFPSLASSGGMPQSEETLAEFLQNSGYINRFVGVWDLGLGKSSRFLPLEQGFQSWFGILAPPTDSCGSIASHKQFYDEVALFLCLLLTALFGTVLLLYFRYLKLKYLLYCFTLVTVLYATSQDFDGISFMKRRSCVLLRDTTILAQPYNVMNLTLRFTEEAVSFINQTQSMQAPFFLMVNHVGLSKPFFHSDIFASEKPDRLLGSLMELDWSVGSILRAIEDVGVADDTLVIFTALSGINHANRTTNKEEHDSWETNLKVPLLMRWNKKWTSGVTINQTVSLMDIMPTIFDLISLNYENGKLDGKSFLPSIFSTDLSDSLHEFFFHYHDVTRPSAVTYGKCKAFFTTTSGGNKVYHEPPLLYDIGEDPDEMTPLPAEEYQQVIITITEAVEKHLENRTRKWISQFEHPILPWLFPCSDFPYCYKPDNYKISMKFD